MKLLCACGGGLLAYGRSFKQKAFTMLDINGKAKRRAIRWVIMQQRKSPGGFESKAPLVPVSGNLNASAYWEILYNSMLPALLEQSRKGFSLLCIRDSKKMKYYSSIWKIQISVSTLGGSLNIWSRQINSRLGSNSINWEKDSNLIAWQRTRVRSTRRLHLDWSEERKRQT